MNRTKYINNGKLAGLILISMVALYFACTDPSGDEKVPLITSFTPLRAGVDKVITIYGRNFSPVAGENIVRINGYECPQISSSSTEIKIITRPGINSGRISVTVGKLFAMSIQDFTLATHSFKFTPENGAADSVITFTGYNFSDLSDSVTLSFFDSLFVDIYDYETVNDTTKRFKADVPAEASTGNVIVKIGVIEVESDTVFTIDGDL